MSGNDLSGCRGESLPPDTANSDAAVRPVGGAQIQAQPYRSASDAREGAAGSLTGFRQILPPDRQAVQIPQYR